MKQIIYVLLCMYLSIYYLLYYHWNLLDHHQFHLSCCCDLRFSLLNYFPFFIAFSFKNQNIIMIQNLMYDTGMLYVLKGLIDVLTPLKTILTLLVND